MHLRSYYFCCLYPGIYDFLNTQIDMYHYDNTLLMSNGDNCTLLNIFIEDFYYNNEHAIDVIKL